MRRRSWISFFGLAGLAAQTQTRIDVPTQTKGGTGGGSATAGDGIKISGTEVSVDQSVPAIAISGSQSLTFGTIASGASAQMSMSVPGALIGDRIVAGWPATLADGLVGIMYVPANDQVAVRLCKVTTGNAAVVGLTFTYQIIRGR